MSRTDEMNFTKTVRAMVRQNDADRQAELARLVADYGHESAVSERVAA